MKGIRWIVLACIFHLSVAVAGQDQDSVRSQHVKKFSDYFFAGMVLKKRDFTFELTSQSDKNARFSFKPNNAYSVGLFLNIFEVGVEASLSVPIDVKNQQRYGTSTSTDLQVNAISKSWILDAFHQRYSGFYFTSPNLVVPDNQPYPHRDDLETRNVGLSFSYIFNANKFSLRSAYTFTEKQRMSRGSFLFSYILSSFDLHADSALVEKASLASFGQGSNSNDLRFTSLGIGPGYSYNFVVKNFFLNLTLSAGPAHYWIRYTDENGNIFYDIRINGFTVGRVGIGYNGDRFFGGLSYSSQSRDVKFEEVIFNNSIGTFRLMLGYRFKEKGILQKRAIDYSPLPKRG